MLVATRAEMDLAIAHWLLSATEARDRARMEWQESGVTMLKTGTLFSAIRMSERLVHAAVGTGETDAVNAYLDRALLGGPVIHDPRQCRYYALVPASTAARWKQCRDTDAFGRDAYVGVPRPGLNTCAAEAWHPYWAVPMSSAGELCSREAVAQLVSLGRYRLAEAGPNVRATPDLHLTARRRGHPEVSQTQGRPAGFERNELKGSASPTKLEHHRKRVER
jgi:hypothetical protein